MPPDTSLSDLTDFTPLDTPLMSRRSSVTGSYQTSRPLALVPQQPSASLTQRALQAAAAAMGPSSHAGSQLTEGNPHSTALSDPEDGEDWSSDDDEGRSQDSQIGGVVADQALPALRGRTQARSPLASPPINAGQNTCLSGSGPGKARTPSAKGLTSPRTLSSPLARDSERESTSKAANSTTTTPGDRKRAVSSSSAFGSRARVKQHNMQRRRRPLSFQQAIESLLLGREGDMSWAEGKRGSAMARSVDDVRLDATATRRADEMGLAADQAGSEPDDGSKPLQNSAPAEFSRPSSPQNGKGKRRVSIVDARDGRQNGEQGADTPELQNVSKQSKFFVGGGSFEGSEHSNEGESIPRAASLNQGSEAEQPTTESRPQHAAKAPSEHSTEGNRTRDARAHHSHTSHAHHGAGHHARGHHGHHGHHGLNAAARNKSAIGLSRPGALGRGRGHSRVSSTGKSSTNVAAHAARSPEKAIEAESKSFAKPDSHPSELATSRASDGKAETSAPMKKKRPPVTFTMGSLEDESEEDDEAVVGAPSRTPALKTGNEVDNSDDWSSDSSTDSEQERRRVMEEKKRAEKERQQQMFKKIPIRSQSAADVSLLRNGADRRSSELESGSQAPPARGLLSTIFHPEQHEPLVGRPHASAADLRLQQKKPQPRKTSHDDPATSSGQTVQHKDQSSVQLPRPPSMGNVGSFGGGLKMSKSAVALPVLSTMGSRSSANVSRADVQGSRNAAVFEDESSDEDRGGPQSGGGGGGAIERLNELAHLRQKQKRSSQQRSSASEQSQHSEQVRTSGVVGSTRKRTSNSSLDVQVSPEMNEEQIRQQRRTSAPTEGSSTPAISTPVRLPHRSKSAVDVPEVGLPQSPRTTRRNMLRDELSESLRQNLLWERQSRHRMLGIGAAGPTMTSVNQPRSSMGQFASASQPQQAPQNVHQGFNRTQTVLGGNALRPLTTRSTSGNVDRDPLRYTGDFHHTGW